MTEPHCLCEQCKMTVLQCKERSAKSSDVLDELIAHFRGFENQKEFQYSASDIIQYLTNFKKLVELRTKERERMRKECEQR